MSDTKSSTAVRIAKVSKIAIEKNDKTLLVVHFDTGAKWYPKLTEVGKICSGIGKAEDKKYPNGKGYKYPKEFIDKCWGKTREEIDSLYLEFDPNKVTKESRAIAEDMNEVALKGWNAAT